MVVLSIAINLGIVVWRIMVESVVPKIKLYCRKRIKTEDKQHLTQKTKQNKKLKQIKQKQNP